MKLNVLHVMIIVRHVLQLNALAVKLDIMHLELIVLPVKQIAHHVLNWYAIHVSLHIKFIKIRAYFVKLDVKCAL